MKSTNDCLEALIVGVVKFDMIMKVLAKCWVSPNKWHNWKINTSVLSNHNEDS